MRPYPDSSGLIPPERDACAIIAYINKEGRPTHGNVQRTIEALVKMGHRAGEIGGEGDGCGILTDIPRTLWREALAAAGRSPELAEAPGFAVGHLLVPGKGDPSPLREEVLGRLRAAGAEILVERPGAVRSEVLASSARRGEPLFRQVALLFPEPGRAPALLHGLHLELETETPVHVASLSTRVASYKIQGSPEMLNRYYPELKRRDFLSSVTIGHSRFSTNTLPTVLRAQPFTLLGHNGEINTIARLREEARMLGIPLPPGGSDSQDLNRTLEGLIHGHGLTLFEAMEVLFPPIFSEMEKMPEELREAYTFIRRFFPVSAQGPAAIIARDGDRCVFSVDAMGLRPLWFGETEKEFFASSEAGVVPHEEILSDPRPLAPGEKIALRLAPGRRPRVLEHEELRREVAALFRRRLSLPLHAAALRRCDAPALPCREKEFARGGELLRENLLSALAWKSSDLRTLQEMAQSGEDPIVSLGYDGPLAALASGRQNLSDYFKEQVAVVTNPAIDREREAEHFSTRVHLGAKPKFRGTPRPAVALAVPLLTGGRHRAPTPQDEGAASRFGVCTLEALLGLFARQGRPGHRLLSCALRREEDVPAALKRLGEEAVSAAGRGVSLLVLDDALAFAPGRAFLDPFLAVAAVHGALRDRRDSDGSSLRRRTSLVLRSGALRNLHDLIFSLGMGADALCPYLVWELAAETEGGIGKVLSVLAKGLEKVISTMGTHEIAGYGRYFASIGLAPEVAAVFETPGFCGSDRGGLGFARLLADGRERAAVARSRDKEAVPTQFRLYPRIWKMVGAVAKMEESYADFSRQIRQLEAENPLALRHLLDFRFTEALAVDPQDVDPSAGTHALPILFSAMSFGSQGETPFRIYAEAARRLNILCMNGEGGEIPDMLGRYRGHRGQQVASGRFGVHMDLLNSADVLEIKVGQGAKPGEGGHLPGFKVTAKIAAARNAAPGMSLISPSNNHDIYSIEDLAQMVEELRTANPAARISVKVPAVAGLGTIALGIVKANADIITVSGYDGGTGAARKHAVKFVGLPAEIGVREAHRALVEAGVRSKVEIWADGGARTGRDVVKLMLLGADRVGFATLPMMVIGCTACRGCHLDTCHVGIATQVETAEEAARRGMKRFVPRVLENGVIYETTFFRALGEEVRTLTARLGFRRTRDLVGRADLLVQARGEERLDLSDLLAPAQAGPPPEPKVRIIRKPLNYLTSLISTLVTEAFESGEERVRYDDYDVGSADRALGTKLAGAMNRAASEGRLGAEKEVLLHFRRDSIPGNGLGAFNVPRINIRVEGGAQDGVGKGARGGRIVVLKGENRSGQRVGGSVGKGLAYGATGGTIFVQGDADSRACVRLSGADVVIGGRIRAPLDDAAGNIAGRANIKGFAFEYMTAGRAVVLGDPGPWICSGMTGGVVYCRLDPGVGMDGEALRRRLARGAKVEIRPLEESDADSLKELLAAYRRELFHSGQGEEAEWVARAAADCRERFVKIVPEGTPPVTI